MRRFAATWPDPAILQSAVGKLPWGHVVTLLNRLADTGDRDRYADQAATNGWSGKVLDHHIATGLRRRIASGPSNFDTHLAGADSDLAQEIVRDPYVFDFLNLTARATERDVEQAMMARLQETLLELGSGFAFVGRQVRLDVDGEEFFVDLLLFHVVQLRYVVVELKVDKFRPEHAGQLQFYLLTELPEATRGIRPGQVQCVARVPTYGEKRRCRRGPGRARRRVSGPAGSVRRSVGAVSADGS